jgi:aspartyl protease family protein
MDSTSTAQLIYLVLLLCAVGGWVIVEHRKRLGQVTRSFAAWALIFVGVMAGYGLWSDLQSDFQQKALVAGDRIEVPRAPDGHFYLTLDIAGAAVPFMIDTGASNIVLSAADAREVGIDPASLAYVGQARTANGVVTTARIRLPSVELGPWRDEDVAAYVTSGEMEGSLLGMDYLGRFHIEIAGNRLILRR